MCDPNSSILIHHEIQPSAEVSMKRLPTPFSSTPFSSPVAQFGSSIVEMQDHITGLQKNLDTFKAVQASLTGK
jgi:hypothetical protein